MMEKNGSMCLLSLTTLHFYLRYTKHDMTVLLILVQQTCSEAQEPNSMISGRNPHESAGWERRSKGAGATLGKHRSEKPAPGVLIFSGANFPYQARRLLL